MAIETLGTSQISDFVHSAMNETEFSSGIHEASKIGGVSTSVRLVRLFVCRVDINRRSLPARRPLAPEHLHLMQLDLLASNSLVCNPYARLLYID